MRPTVVLVFVLAACGLGFRAGASDRPPTDLSALLEEVDRASPQLLAVRARAEAAANVAPQREALPDPRLSASYTNDGLSSFTLGDSEFANITVGWEQEVPVKAVRSNAAAVARTQAETLRATTTTASATLRARIISLYAELWRVDRTMALLAERRTLLITAAQAAQARYESGEGIQEGLIRAQTAVHRVDLELEELALARREAEIALGSTLGRAEDPAFGPAGGLPEIAGPIDAEGLADAAIASSPDVLETSARERTAAAQLDDARVQVKPTYSWVAAYQYRGGLDPMVMGGFSVRLPVWKDRKQERAIAGAAIERTAAEHDRAAAEVAARAGTRRLAAELASIDARLRLYREAIVPQSAAALDAAGAALASGRGELFLVLDDFERWISARKGEVALSAQRIETIASLEAATGTRLIEMPAQGRPQ
jgi:cobalt-zinc-cadmium efflux system outer membrane protein